MKITKERFFAVGAGSKIAIEQLNAFWTGLERDQKPSNAFSSYLYYLGALIVIAAMTWFMTLGWERFGGGGIFVIALIYALVFALLGSHWWDREGLRVPAGLLITIAVCMTPLAIYGLETYWGIWPGENPGNYQGFYQWVKGSWIFMEIGTIVAGAIALRFFPFPFLTAPVFFAVWFMSMDITPLVFGDDTTPKYWVTLFFGLILLGIGFALDRRYKEDYGFWAYLFGAIAFWGGLGCLVWDKGEGILVVYLIVNLLLMCLSILLSRTVLMVFGSIGVFAYLGHLAYNIFRDSVLFPFTLSIIGLAIIYLGVLYHKNQLLIAQKLLKILPASLRTYLTSRDL